MATDKWNGFKGAAKQIEDRDLGRIAAMIGVGEDEVHALMDVEAAGEGFDAKGRPKALYEPHVAWRCSHGAVRDKLAKAGLAYPKWKKGYPKDSYARIAAAVAIDETVGLMATSWGFGQVLGENHRMCGYVTVQAMVKAMMADEENHLIAMVEFVKSAHIDDDMRELAKLKRPTTPADCVSIVRVYNGPGYKANNYHVKFAAAHNKWRKIKDTDWRDGKLEFAGSGVIERTKPDAQPAVVMVKPEDVDHVEGDVRVVEAIAPSYKNGKVNKEVENVQKRLDELGYPEVGSVDGKWGSKTAAAILAFRNDNNLPTVPEIDVELLSALMSAGPRPIAPERANATVAELRAEGAEDVAAADQTQTAGVAVAGLGAVGGAGTLLESLDGYSGVFGRIAGYIEPVQDFIKDNFWIIAIAGGAFVIWKSGVLKNIRLVKHQTGQDVSR